MNQREIKKLLLKKPQELTGDEQKLLDTWYRSLGNKDSVNPFSGESEEIAVKERLRSRIDQSLHPVAGVRRRRLAAWIGSAAAVALLAFGIFFYMSNHRSGEIPQHRTVSYHTTFSPAGKLKKVLLTDGSVVWLNGNSTLKHPENFADTTREVLLEGEGFFEIAQDAAKPFVVRTGELHVRVLGTSFNIKAYEGLDDISVNVATGKIRVDHGSETLGEVNPDEQITFNKETGMWTAEKYSSRAANGWREGMIRLNGAGMKELSVLFENTFGYTIETNLRRLEKVRFTAGFRRQDKLNDILDMLCRIPSVNYRIEGKKITFY